MAATGSGPEAKRLLPAITRLRKLEDSEVSSTLDLLFERSRDLHALASASIRTASFESYEELITTLRDQLLSLATDAEVDARKTLHAILGSHPRLGECSDRLSAQSSAEQRQIWARADDEAERLAELNREYEARFPGLRYVVFVAGRGRDVIMRDMRRRIDRGDGQAEEREAIEAMCDIARDRVKKLERTNLGV